LIKPFITSLNHVKFSFEPTIREQSGSELFSFIWLVKKWVLLQMSHLTMLNAMVYGSNRLLCLSDADLTCFVVLSIQLILLLDQWFPNFSGARTTKNILVLREAQNIDLYWDSRTTWASMADHLWSAEQTLGNTVLDNRNWIGFVRTLRTAVGVGWLAASGYQRRHSPGSSACCCFWEPKFFKSVV
jgi:hypothetical protein